MINIAGVVDTATFAYKVTRKYSNNKNYRALILRNKFGSGSGPFEAK